MNDRIKPPNPVARAVAYNRPRQQVIKPKKGKGAYDRKQINNNNTKGKNKYDFFI